MGTTVLF